MNLLSEIFYRPLYNLLIFFLGLTWGNMGLAIILLTILVRLLLYIPTRASLKSQKRLQALQPKINELKAQYKDNKEEFSRALMKLYATEKVNPFSSCLSILIQLPFLFALYAVFQAGLNGGTPPGLLYSFIAAPSSISNNFFGMSLIHPNAILSLLAALSQFAQARMMPRTPPPAPVEGSKDEQMLSAMNKQMLYVMPVMTFVIGLSIPAGLTLYWGVSTVLFILQQWYMMHTKENPHKPRPE